MGGREGERAGADSKHSENAFSRAERVRAGSVPRRALDPPGKRAGAAQQARVVAARPTSWTPSGRPVAPSSSGRLTAGRPQSVQSVQKTGSPVASRPAGASPVVAGVRMAS